MNFLLDTNVISEFVKPDPSSHVLSWINQAEEAQLFISVVTLAEVGRGIEQLAPSKRRTKLETWFSTALLERFSGRIIPIFSETAIEWGRIVAARRKAGRIIATMDAFIAATAIREGLTLVTRDVSDFEGTGVPLMNPWGD